MALIRDFVFTAITTNAFKVAVKGSVTMLIAVRKIRRALTSVAEDGSEPPSKYKTPHRSGSPSLGRLLGRKASRFACSHWNL